MGNFLAIVPSEDFQDEADQLFRCGLEVACQLKVQVPSKIVDTNWVRAASFPRRNGSGTPIVAEPQTGSWLLAIGTWFHVDDYAAGGESRLLRRYLEVGPLRLAEELEGFFVIVVGDARTRETIVLTDVIGSCHCFARSCGHTIALSGSSLLLAGLGGFGLDPVGCQEFLSTGIIYESRTFYQEVKKLGPASISRFKDGARKAEQCYWRIADLAPESLGQELAVRTLWEKLVRAARKVGGTFTQPVCDLTGGYDSRALAAAFLAAGVPFSTVVSGPEGSPDVVVSRGLAQSLGLPHLHVVHEEASSFEQVKEALAFTDGEYDLIEYARVLTIHRMLSERFEISINGSFGEVARGYWWELLFPHAGARRALDAYKLARYRYGAHVFDASIYPQTARLDLIPHLAGVIERTNAGLDRFPNTLQMDHAYLGMRMQRWQGRIASSTNQVWPCLSPFLFRSVLETMLRTTARLRQRSLLIRKLLADFQPHLAEFPLEHGYPALPATWRTLHRFWPLLTFYGRKIVEKAGRKLGASKAMSASAPGHVSARLQLWQQEEVRELLRPAAMKLGAWADASALENFLQRSQQNGFAFDSQWARVLSLEYTLRALERVSSRLVS